MKTQLAENVFWCIVIPLGTLTLCFAALGVLKVWEWWGGQMNFLGFICWLRGYHLSYFVCNKWDEVTGFCGEAKPCSTCGKILQEGSWNLGTNPSTTLTLEWRDKGGKP